MHEMPEIPEMPEMFKMSDWPKELLVDEVVKVEASPETD